MRFSTPSIQGLGDRFAQLLVLATVGYLNRATIVTTWADSALNEILCRRAGVKIEKGESCFNRTGEYPADPTTCVHFPNSLRLIDTYTLMKTEKYASYPQASPAGPGYQEGWDHIPETSFISLTRGGHFPKNTTFESFMSAMRLVSGQFKFLFPELLKLDSYDQKNDQKFEQQPGIMYSDSSLAVHHKHTVIHLRRGDRGANATVPNDLAKILEESNKRDPDAKYVVISDSEKAKLMVCNIVKCFKLPHCAPTVCPFRDFFLMVHAKQIIQSVIQTCDYPQCGWSAYSFVASTVGNVPLMTCAKRIRIALAEKYL